MGARRTERAKRTAGAAANGRVLVGTSGYEYPHWRGIFYPHELPRARWLEFYAERFATVEINNTFYRLPSRETFERWRERVPAQFVFAVKFNRYATHIRRLRDPEATVGRFLEAATGLGEKLGPILVQLPPRWNADPDRLAAFVEATPRVHRWVLEVRDRRWLQPAVFDVLRTRGWALCIHDLLPDHPWEMTADFCYLRFHGVDYGGCYTEAQLEAVADRLRPWLDAGRDVYAYFNNDREGFAVVNALSLRSRLSCR